MPYCEAYNGNGQCSQGHNPKNDCLTSTCWFRYWTPAERAGLKAIGQEYKFRTRLFELTQPYFAVKETGMFMIHSYVRAARKEKED